MDLLEGGDSDGVFRFILEMDSERQYRNGVGMDVSFNITFGIVKLLEKLSNIIVLFVGQSSPQGAVRHDP